MKAFIISDLHTDHINGSRTSEDKILKYLEPKLCPADVLIVAGDISDSARVFSRTINALCKLYPKVVYCLGNHDYTVHSVNNETSYQKAARAVSGITNPNAIHLNGQSFNISNNSKIGGSMGAYDFSYSEKYFGLSFDAMLALWPSWYDGTHWNLGDKTYKDFLNDESLKIDNLIHKDACNIMVTHIGPKAWDIPNKFHNKYTGYFYFDGQRYLDAMPSGSTWIFGHTHDQKILDLGNVRLLCNPLGYPGEIRYTIPKEEFLIDLM